IDLIDIAAPTIDHADLAIQAAQAGKHCLCEKPLALGEKEFARMAQAFETSGTVLGGIFQCRFADEVRQLQDMITSGQLGNILTASSATKWWRDNSYFDPFQRRTYATAGGGVLMVQAIHAIDLVFQLFGKPVHSEVSLRYGDGGLPSYVEVEHTATVTLEFSSGATADIFATIRAEEARAAGDHMSRMSSEKHTITVTGDMSVMTIGENLLSDPAGLFGRNIDNLAWSILTGNTPIVSCESAMQTVRLIQDIYRLAGVDIQP
ncbi:MAG: Gfo/Idh/MocA family oxidoreductase, partial [Candidatus Margulisiibacteriota bacterium]